jgi:hypothetical protein
LVDGNPLGAAIKGTGRDRLLETGALTEDTTLTLHIRSDDPIVVERVFSFTVQVRPAATDPVSARRRRGKP